MARGSSTTEQTSDAALWIALSQINGLGGQSFCQLLSSFGNPAAIYAASFNQLRAVVSEPIASEIIAGPDFDALAPTLDWLNQAGNHLVTLADSNYPQQLLQI